MALDPVWATLAGVAGFGDRMADLTPDSFEARAELDRRTIAAVARWLRPVSPSTPQDPRDHDPIMRAYWEPRVPW